MTSHDMRLLLDEHGHVPAIEMARYVDGTGDRGARAWVTRHLADCEECREELMALRRLVPPRSRLTTRVGALVGAAAAVTLITLSWRGTLTPRTDALQPDRTRANSTVTEIEGPFPVAFPAPDALISSDSVRLIWHAAGPDASYRVVLQDESGGVVFAGESSDTSMVVPAKTFPWPGASATEQPARSYYWKVEARLLDGRSANTGLHRVRIR